MTVCISASADRGERTVHACDTRLSIQTTSTNPLVGRKMSGSHGWTILASGNFGLADRLLDTVYAELNGAADNDPPTVEMCLNRALRAELPRFSAARFLAPYGIDMPMFLASHDVFTQERWNELSRQILEYCEEYDVELIVSDWGRTQESFDASRQRADAYIFSVNRNGVHSHTNEQFYACGSGGYSAYSLLSFFDYQAHMNLAEAVYYVSAAKFISERADGVGQNTVIRIHERTGGTDWNGYFLQPEQIRILRDIWESRGAPRMPDGAEEQIGEILRPRPTRTHSRTA
jgi:hypothetical protein